MNTGRLGGRMSRATVSRGLFARAVAVLLLALGLGSGTPAVAKPNIVLILVDDQEVGFLDQMPNVKRLVAQQGATFASAYFNDPLCCPSRATILTGRYVHNTGVTKNDHALFYNSDMPNRTVAVWLRAAGYRTALIGKYLNLYPQPAPGTYVPPGWSFWAVQLGGNSYYDYTLNENGRLVKHASAATDYSTDVYRQKALDFLRSVPANTPFFLQLAVNAPHKPYTAAPRHASLFPNLKAPKPPSFNEADVSDKPEYIRSLGPFTPEMVSGMDYKHRQRARILRAVDEAVKAIADALAASGRLSDTYLVYTSDNGWLHGQHRLRARKGQPYEEGIRMPLYVSGPGVRAGSVVPHLVGNVDLAPTFAEWAGAAAADDIDGRSFAPLLRDGAPAPEDWRQAFPLRYDRRSTDGTMPSWRGVHTRRHAYVEYASGERELYDLAADPYQLRNAAAAADPDLIERLSRLTASLNACAGPECRRLEDAPVGP